MGKEFRVVRPCYILRLGLVLQAHCPLSIVKVQTLTSACACTCVSQDAPPRGEQAGLSHRGPTGAPLTPGLTVRGLLGFPRHVRSLFVLDWDRWRAFYAGRLNEGPGDFYGC